MRLITHNVLQCHAKQCPPGASYPLALRNVELEAVEAEFNEDFVRRMLDRLDWNVLVDTAFVLGIAQLPKEIPELRDTEFLKAVHKVILETRVKEAEMVCNGCGHVYPIKDGIPNMLLQDHEL
ncbi:uncharacterized protein EV422DRAFT_536130 [Fimicolochytrium jonesii]|uniref:uncharacterized protein n=1 Tax=Fimicolochytrium jonesii TaxID=1396493 RepID=UPI0022FF4175|nr:uncharacterized protein EV422DRAFT_536130 [Fimicolochytrium jonesii]KAI8818973.1 hypothetical protein EV422DRAFT_536130 [Fimicolochytrium jonesii]